MAEINRSDSLEKHKEEVRESQRVQVEIQEERDRLRKCESARYREFAINSLEKYDVSEDLNKHLLDAIHEVGELSRNIISRNDLVKSLSVMSAGERHIKRSERAVKNMETQIISLFSETEDARLHIVQCTPLAQQIQSALDQLPTDQVDTS
mmetsp:Transcript_10835/g.17738  ORF Transcript_10835/g.17738 Transcript_10835/m.17738 type:complete len:151 (+) Transcript_10835:162-614(+)|eukprot:CAMPEP_0203767718 /NCGR_PEP_ID=MMETSP0099_2-20121227/1160_1 /ASSEMBLY_ACC=CAM_ASM_000209 /TAXON_ID=96639 /ORGANISM=" , Strain NY0313808BC1" /LENGTH=150 /DNA_ID=CAMNT_0050664273 /DNA_START=76 /DNA_END=528 /DNA_ORIENTATION=+